MVTYFNKKDLVSFGNYLLSEKRKARFQASYDEAIARGENPITPEESMSNVWHPDICNWMEEQKFETRSSMEIKL